MWRRYGAGAILCDLQVAEPDAVRMGLLRQVVDGVHAVAACFAR